MTGDEWMTVPDAARLLGKSERTIRRWIDAGKLDTDRIGPRLLVQVPGEMADKGQAMPSDKVTIAVLEARVQALEQFVQQLTVDKEAWMRQAQVLAAGGSRQLDDGRRRFRWPWEAKGEE